MENWYSLRLNTNNSLILKHNYLQSAYKFEIDSNLREHNALFKTR
jgi:hypothetical protein